MGNVLLVATAGDFSDHSAQQRREEHDDSIGERDAVLEDDLKTNRVEGVELSKAGSEQSCVACTANFIKIHDDKGCTAI